MSNDNNDNNEKVDKKILLPLGLIILGLVWVFTAGNLNVSVLDPELMAEVNLTVVNQSVKITDGEDKGYNLVVNSDGSINTMNLQHDTRPLDIYMQQETGKVSILTISAEIDSYNLTVLNVTDYVIGNWLLVAGEGRIYQAELINIVGNVLIMDQPLDFNFSVGSPVVAQTRDLNVDGSINREIFEVIGPPIETGEELEVIRIMIIMETVNEIDLNKFGDITGGLTNGIVLRRIRNNIYQNIWNVKTNGEIGNHAYDLTIYTATNPAQGINGLLARYTFGGLDKHDNVITLGVNDTLQILISDDLSSLEKFRIQVQARVKPVIGEI